MFLLQILLLAQHVSGTSMPISRSSRLLYSGCCLWYFVLWFSSYCSGVELRVMCRVCKMLQHPAFYFHILLNPFSSTFAKLRKAAINIVMSVRMGQLDSHCKNFHEIWYLSICRIIFWENSSFIKINKNNMYFTWIPLDIFYLSRSFLLRMRNISDENCRENQNTNFIFNIFFPKIVPFVW